MTGMKRVVLIALVLATTLGCARTSFDYASRTDGRKEELSRTFYMVGLVNTNEPLRAYDFCPEGVKSITTVHTFGDALLSFLTLTIWTPNTVRITCQGPSAHQFYIDENDEIIAREPVASGVATEAAYSDVF